MPHWKSMMDRDYIYAFDLGGRDVTVTIAKVVAGEIKGTKGKANKKPIAYFEGKEKGLALNSTNCKTIAALYGNDTAAWVGKRITLYPTTTEMAGDTVECIRVRPKKPNGTAKHAPTVPPTPDEAREALGEDDAAMAARDEDGAS